MNIDVVPDHVLLQIIECLPFKDRVRLGGVNGRFNQISKTAIFKMKSLELNEDMVAFSASTSFVSLLDSCWATLERINIAYKCNNKLLLKMLSQYTYPKLKCLEIAILPAFGIDADPLRKCAIDLITLNCHVKSIVIRPGLDFEFPLGVAFENLENLELLGSPMIDKEMATYNDMKKSDYDRLLGSLFGRVGSLKRCKIQVDEMGEASSVFATWPVINNFLSFTLNLKSLHLSLYFEVRDLYSKANLRNLHSLTSFDLNIRHLLYYAGDFSPCFLAMPTTILDSFPRLERFASDTVTDGILIDSEKPMDRLERLRELRLPGMGISDHQFLRLLESCPVLRWLDIKYISDTDSPESCAKILDSISHNRSGKLCVRFSDLDRVRVWRSNMVKTKLEEIKNKTGFDIEVACALPFDI